MRSVEQRFWEKVGPHTDPNVCWLWSGCTIKSRGELRYGRFWDGTRRVLVHRLSYAMHYHVTIPEGMTIDHVKTRGCTSTLCVNPYHLEVVTHRENVLRGDAPSANNAKKTHCPQGHPYNKENTYTRYGQRYCRICQRETKKVKGKAI